MRIMKKIIFLIFMMLLFLNNVFADDSFEILSEVTKYYKIVTNYERSMYFLSLDDYNSSNIFSSSYEISEEEYENDSNIHILSSGIVETTYKKMTTSISKNDKYYRYKNIVVWKKMPKIRSYDVIAIGFNSNVKISGTPISSLKYDSKTLTNSNFKKTNTGASSTFKLPSGTYSNVIAELYFNVEKNASATILTQKVYGDYAHSTSSVSLNNASKHSINTSGINFDSSVVNSFDDISCAVVTLNNNW